jgi:mannosyltransferase
MSTILPAQPGLPVRGSEVAHVRPKVSFEVLALSSIIVLCAALRFFHLGAASLWSDEMFSRYYVDVFGLHYVFTEGLSREPSPPTYYLLLRAWITLFGDSEVALRSLSALASTLCVPIAYLLGRELESKLLGLAGALLVALCPMSLYFGQEARVYIFLMLAGSVMLWAASVFERDARSSNATVFYVLSATLCLYLHATGLLFVVACAGAVWLWLIAKGAAARRARLKWIALNAVILLFGLPYYVHALTAGNSGIINYMPAAGIHQLVYCVSQVVSGIVTPYPWPAFPLAAAVLVALAVSLYRHPLSRRAAVILLGVPCLFITLLLLISLRRPILMPRVLIFTVVPLCLIAGRQILTAGRARFAVLLALLAAFGTGLFYQMTASNSDKEPWRDISLQFAPQLAHADLVVLSPVSNPEALRYYSPQVKNVRLWDASTPKTIMNDAAQRLHVAPITEPEILEAIKTNHSVWVVAHSFDLKYVNDLRSQVPPTVFRIWYCGKVPCVAAAGWQPHP